MRGNNINAINNVKKVVNGKLNVSYPFLMVWEMLCLIDCLFIQSLSPPRDFLRFSAVKFFIRGGSYYSTALIRKTQRSPRCSIIQAPPFLESYTTLKDCDRSSQYAFANMRKEGWNLGQWNYDGYY